MPDDLTFFFTILGSASVKAVCRMLMNLSPGFNFINVLLTTFTLVDPKSVKNTVNHKYLFMPLGSMSAKAVRRMLVKLSPGLNFINIFCALFSYERHFGSFFSMCVCKKAAEVTFVRKMRAKNVDEIDWRKTCLKKMAFFIICGIFD
jgi:hypothetical protein